MANIRIAKITYDNHPVDVSENGIETIGQQIDRFIRETVTAGSLVSEVSLFFETPEEQYRIADLFRSQAVAAFDYGTPAYKSKPVKRG